MKPWEKYRQQSVSGPWNKYKQPEQDEGPLEHDFSVTNMVKNIPGSAAQLVKDVVQPILHPVDTVESLGNLGSGIGQKIFEATSDSKDIVYANEGNKKIAEDVGAAMKERYGGWNEIKRTAEQDPVGILSDVAGILTGGGGLAAKQSGTVGKFASMANKTGKAIDPLNLASNSIRAIPNALPDSLPAKMYESSAKFGTTLDPDLRTKMTETALRENIMPTEKGLKKLNSVIESEMNQVDNILNIAEAGGKTIPKTKMLSRAREARNKVSKITTPDAAKRIAQADDVIDSFGKQWESIDSLSPNQAQELKRELDKVLRWDKKQLQSQNRH